MKVSFKGIKPGAAGGVYFKPGNYIVEIDSMKIKTVRKTKGDMLIVSTIVHESDNPELKAGARPSHTLNITDDNMGILMALVMRVNGLNPDEELSDEEAAEIEALYEECVGDANAAQGRFCRVEAYLGELKDGTKTRRNGQPLVFCNFFGVTDEEQAEYTKKYGAKVA